MTEKTQKIVYKMLVDIEKEVQDYKEEFDIMFEDMKQDINAITYKALKEMRGKR